MKHSRGGRLDCRPSVKFPHVDLPAFVTKLEWSGTTEPAEINFIDPDTGIVVYTTPMLPNIPKARERAINWARRHGFHYDITDRGHFTRRSA